MGFSEEEYNALSVEEQEAEKEKARMQYIANGANYVINNMSELCSVIDEIEACSVSQSGR